MPTSVFFNGTAILPDRTLERARLLCRDGVIVAIDASSDFDCADLLAEVADRDADRDAVQFIDAGGGYISPGFVDIHVHGGAGADFMDGTADAVRTACTAHRIHGTTTIFPTTTTGSPEQISAMIDACRTVQGEFASTIAGIHLYGPFFAPDKVGCHAQAGRREPQPEEYQGYFDSGMIAIATCAAELPGAEAFYRSAQAQGCLITCGHSNASWAEMAVAMQCGMRHVDHFWCAMSSVASVRQRLGVPMQGSMSEFVLMHNQMSTEVIADGCHLSPELLEFAYRMIGPDRLCLVTDCNRALDMPPGEYRFGSCEDGTWFRSDGRVGWAPNGSLASSIVGMDFMVRSMIQQSSASLPEVVRMATLTPARRTGIADRTGSLEIGKAADILILDSDFNVQRVFVGGVE